MSSSSAWCGCGSNRRSSSPLPWEVPTSRWRRNAPRQNQGSISSTTAILEGSDGLGRSGSDARGSSFSTSSIGGGRLSTTTQDTLLPPDTLLIPDILLPMSDNSSVFGDFSTNYPPFAGKGVEQPHVRRSSAENPNIAPEVMKIEHVSQLDFPADEGLPCLFCRWIGYLVFDQLITLR